MILLHGEKKYPNGVKQIGQFENTNLLVIFYLAFFTVAYTVKIFYGRN